MKERPILFSGPMVRAILEGRKTMTRRVVKPQPASSRPHDGGTVWRFDEKSGLHRPYGTVGHLTVREKMGLTCPYGQPGDRLWVRETCRYEDTFYRGADKLPDCFRAKIEYAADKAVVVKDVHLEHWRTSCESKTDSWRPSIHMPRWACRLVLEVVSVRVERLQEISEEDALAEGVRRIAHGREGYFYHHERTDPHPQNWCHADDAFREMWDSINKARGYGWDVNPWVWVVEFKRVEFSHA